MKGHAVKHLFLPYLVLLSLAFSNCTVHYVADYDESIHNEIIRISGQVEKFFIQLADTDPSERTYNHFKDQYIDIEADLRTLLVRNKIRELNTESVQQAQNALDLWLEDKEDHKENNTVSNFIISSHRSQFERIFIAMAKGEAVKPEE